MSGTGGRSRAPRCPASAAARTLQCAYVVVLVLRAGPLGHSREVQRRRQLEGQESELSHPLGDVSRVVACFSGDDSRVLSEADVGARLGRGGSPNRL